MLSTDKNNFVSIGRFLKTTGVFGTLILNLDGEFDDSLRNIPVLFVEIDGLLVPWFVDEDGWRLTGSKTAYVDLKWIDSSETAKKFLGKTVWVEKSEAIIKTETPDEFLVTGYKVATQNKGFIGFVKEINDYAGNVVLTLEKDGNEMLIPFHNDFIEMIDQEGKEILLRLPDGITDL